MFFLRVSARRESAWPHDVACPTFSLILRVLLSAKWLLQRAILPVSMTAQVPTVGSAFRTLAGVSVPAFFYGTAWKEERTRELTVQALDAGFAAIDTANQRRHYVETAVGEAIRSRLSAGRRAELFLQTKFTFARGQDQRIPYDPSAAPSTQVRQSFDSSLEHLGTDYVDSYLLHGPSTSRGLTEVDWEVWRAMEALARAGAARSIGISNVSLDQLSLLYAGAQVKPAFVQNRCYARDGWDREVRAFCREHALGYQAFSLLTANQRELDHPLLVRIAKKAGLTRAQVVFCFALQVGMIPLTGSSSRAHLLEDLKCFELELGPADVAALERMAVR